MPASFWITILFEAFVFTNHIIQLFKTVLRQNHSVYQCHETTSFTSLCCVQLGVREFARACPLWVYACVLACVCVCVRACDREWVRACMWIAGHPLFLWAGHVLDVSVLANSSLIPSVVYAYAQHEDKYNIVWRFTCFSLAILRGCRGF